jgi:hypothetical protein
MNKHIVLFVCNVKLHLVLLGLFDFFGLTAIFPAMMKIAYYSILIRRER